jgi:hypothetical protein
MAYSMDLSGTDGFDEYVLWDVRHAWKVYRFQGRDCQRSDDLIHRTNFINLSVVVQ